MKTAFNDVLLLGNNNDLNSGLLITIVPFQRDSDSQTISILLQNAETVSLVCPPQGNSVFFFFYHLQVWVISLGFLKCYLLVYSGNTLLNTAVPVTSLKVGDEVLLRVQGGARHTGIEIHEFIAENWTKNNVFKLWFPFNLWIYVLLATMMLEYYDQAEYMERGSLYFCSIQFLFCTWKTKMVHIVKSLAHTLLYLYDCTLAFT